MPLSELYRLAKRRVDSNKDFEPGNDVFELVWENGQITTTQGQSSRVRKEPTSNSLSSHCLPSYTPKSRDRDSVGNGTSTSRTGKFGTTVDSVMNEIPMSVPSNEVGLSHDDDMIPWLNYPMDSPDFLPELSGVTVHEISKSNNFASNDKSSCNQIFRESNAYSVDYCASLEQRNVSKVGGGSDATRPRIVASQLCPRSSSQQYQTSVPSARLRFDSVTQHAICSDSARVLSTGFPSPKIQKQDNVPPSSSASIINFSHFSRPVALARANRDLQSMPSMEKMSNKDKGCAINVSNSPPKLGMIDSSTGLRKETSVQSQIRTSSGVDLKLVDGWPIDKLCTGGKDTEAVFRDDTSKNDMSSNQIACESTTRGLLDGEKNAEPVVASSSVCSGNSVERASDEPTHVLKRKFRDTEDSECHSEDVEEESVGVKKIVLPRTLGSKRSRAAEVHNLSERRRRDRINEKMRALQELIPNCNKVDKASMLDEAIEYLKTLQLQVQIMSMGAGLCMPPMMLPTALQHMHTPHVAHFSPMGIGMGMGLGMGFGMGMPDLTTGSSGYPMIQGPHFPGLPMQGMSGPSLQVLGLPGQGMSMPMQRPQLVPMMGAPFMKPAMALSTSGAGGSMENMESAQPYPSKDTVQITGSQVIGQSTGPNSSMNQTSSQCQAMNVGFERSSLVQDNVQQSNGKASASTNGNDASQLSRAANYE